MASLPPFTKRGYRKKLRYLQKLAARPSLRLKADLKKLGLDWRKVLA